MTIGTPRSAAAETLSAVTLIATDKTGTLTENRMAVQRMVPPAQEDRALVIGLLCNDAVQSGDTFTGDPLDVALLRAARESGLHLRAVRAAFPLRAAFSFDSERQRMSTVHGRDGMLWVVAKGAPEAIVDRACAYLTGDGEQDLTSAVRREILAARAWRGGGGHR